jgi:uncharacterized protein YkuJ|nr:MAG TPA: hypothetical protein [Caudoviricetes sp.]
MKNKKLDEELYEIAKENIFQVEGRGNLETQYSNERDFFEISVWQLKSALLAAYELGRNSK